MELAESTKSTSQSFISRMLVSPVSDRLNSFQAWKDQFGLRAPGKIDLIGYAAKDCQATNHLFEGAKATLIKAINTTQPQFIVQHDFEMAGSAAAAAPSKYRFTTSCASDSNLVTASIDHSGNLQARLDKTHPFLGTSSIQAQLSADQSTRPSQFVFDHEFVGKDSTLRFTAIDPTLVAAASSPSLSGAFIACAIQSITPTLSIGGSTTYFRSPHQTGFDTSFIAKLVSLKPEQWAASLNYSPAQSLLDLTYSHKLAQNVEASALVTAVLAGGPAGPMSAAGPAKPVAVASAGVKYSFLTSELRAHVDSTGKVAAVMEQRLNGAMSLLLSGTMDHIKGDSKFGFGFTMHQASEAEQMAAMAQMEAAQQKQSLAGAETSAPAL